MKEVLCLQVKAGQNQADWEKSGWIAAQDPRGWFHWYCRFYQVRSATHKCMLMLLHVMDIFISRQF